MKKFLQLLFILTFFAIEGKSQTMMTIGDVYNFNINDEFQYQHIYIPPKAERIKIIGKYFSALNDTIFYVRHFNNYYSNLISVPTPHLEYFFNSYTDTTFITNLDTLINVQYRNWAIVDSSEDFSHDTMYYSSQTCGRLIYEHTGKSGDYDEDTQFGQGLGVVQFWYWETNIPFDNDKDYMVYYKKDTIECGTPDTTDSASVAFVNELVKFSTSILLFPNPASTVIYIDIRSPESFKLSIFNAAGIFVRRIDNVRNYQPIDISFLTKGFYFVTIESDKKIYQKKIIIE